MTVRKITTLGLTLMLSACLFLTACGSKKENAGQNESGTSKEESYEISMVFVGLDQKEIDEVEAEINKLTLEKINATVDITMINWGNWSQQTTLMLAGNEKVDVLMTSNTLYNYSSQVAKGQLRPLDELLDKYGQGVKAALGDYLDAAKVEGQIYGLPSLRDMAVNYGMMVRGDLLEKHQIETKSKMNLDEVTQMFKAIKEKEPDVTPFVAGIGGTTPLELLYPGYFDLLGNSLGVLAYSQDDLKVVNMYETDEYRDLVNIARDWYEAGYISKDAATTKEDGTTLMKAGAAFSAGGNIKPAVETQIMNMIGMPVKAIEVFPAVQTTGTISSFMFSIPTNSKNPEKTMEFLNLLYTDPDVINLFDYGIEGKHYEKKSDTSVGFPDGVDGSNSGYNLQQGWLFGNQLLSYTWETDPDDLWTQIEEFNEAATKSKALGFTFNSEPVKTEIASVSNVVNQYKMGLETGTVDPEQILPKFIEDLKSAGIDKIIDEKQAQLDAWAATAK